MVAYAALLLLVCCSCLQHTGALQLAYDPSEGEVGGPQSPGELLGALTERQNGRQKRSKRPRGNCDLEWKTTDRLPIILHANRHEIVYPVPISRTQNMISIEYGEAVNIYCPKHRFSNSDLPGRPNPTSENLSERIATIKAYCNSYSGKLVVASEPNALMSAVIATPILPNTFINAVNKNKKPLDIGKLDDILCVKQIDNAIIPTNKLCGSTSTEGKEYHIITFDTDEGEFLTQIKVCFDKTKETTIWTEHILRGVDSQVTGTKPTWREDGGIFTSGMTKIYQNINKPVSKTNDALKSLTTLLGMDVAPPQKFIAKGHLSPNADFKTDEERKATFHYINAVPQFHADNNGNWAHIVEDSVRNLAKKQTDLTIISGGYEILHLKNILKQDVAIYLKPSNGVPVPNRVPVPKFMWKVVYNPTTKKGVAFVTSNDPFIGEPLSPTTKIEIPAKSTQLKPLCKDVCDDLDISWFKGNDRKDYKKGYTYCCRVDDLRNSITAIPSKYANVHNLLGGNNAGK